MIAERGSIDKDLIDSYDEKIVSSGKILFAKRSDFAKEYLPLLAARYNFLTEGLSENVGITYASDLADIDFKTELQSKLDRDIALGRTSIGVHRDDFLFTLNGYELKLTINDQPLTINVNKRIDYLIIGQGLAGSAMAWELLRRGKTIRVIDQPGNTRASVVAAGLINPIAGKFMTKAWKADSVFPYLEQFYSKAGEGLHKKFFHSLPIYRPFISEEECHQWKIRSESEELSRFVAAFHERPAFIQVKDLSVV
ncbi:MAG: FAD-dependent oxidoreductase [Bacteroidota bacterium]